MQSTANKRLLALQTREALCGVNFFFKQISFVIRTFNARIKNTKKPTIGLGLHKKACQD
jgi:hypothetical protein